MERRDIVVWGLCLGMLFCASCKPEEPEEGMFVPKGQLMSIAREYIEGRWPQSLHVFDDRTPLIIVRDNSWEVTFLLPPNMLGGVPHIHIDKSSMKVIKAYHTQ
ncbi:MAG: NTF2 fold immunity protein [Planctomycetia bacterium]|nr:NTF2 fold immunity protein [Planctomycetia bacterium]